MAQLNFKAIGTTWQIDIYKEMTQAEETSLFSLIQKRIDEFDKAYSRFRADSLVTEISKGVGAFTLPDDAKPMMEIYRDLYLRTGGLVTPLIGNLISDAGYDAGYSLVQKKELKSPLLWDEAIEYQHPVLRVKRPVLLDFGAAGKGYLIDIVGRVLEENGVSSYCIDAGGDILHKGSSPIRIGLENPSNTDEVVGVADLADGSICGSAGNRRAWGEFTHIINPLTKTSPKNILAVWVIAKTALIADAIATCLFFVKAETLTPAYEFEYVILYSDHSTVKSQHFPCELFTS